MEATQMINSNNSLEENYLHLDNVKVYYQRHIHQNPKATLFFIHGFLASTFSFRNLIPLLKKDFSIVSIDLPGFGKSEKSLSFHYSYENFGRIAIKAIENLKLKKVVVIGHSMGGQIALHVAKQAPELVQQLYLIASSGYLRRARQLAIYSSYVPFFPWFAKQWYKLTVDINTYFYSHIIDSSFKVTKEEMNTYLEPFHEKNFFKSLVRLLRHREGDLSKEQLARINTPSVLIWGNEDKTVPLSIGKRLGHDLPNAKLISIENTGHLICEETPDRVYQEIVKHLVL